MKTFFLLLFSLSVTITKAQVWDTARTLSRHEGGYAKFSPSIKIALTYNGYAGVEIERVRNNLSLVWLMNNTATKYYGIQWVANKNYKAGLWSIKAGQDIDFRILHIGAALSAQTNFEKIKFYAIPTIGFSWWGTASIYYGFVLHLGNTDFTNNNDFQLGIKYNFTKHLAKTFRDGVD